MNNKSANKQEYTAKPKRNTGRTYSRSTLKSVASKREIKPAIAAQDIKIVLFNKPFDVLCQFTDDANRKTLAEFIPIKEVYAYRIPHSSLVLNNKGLIGIMTVEEDSIAYFTDLDILEDDRDGLWVGGIGNKEANVVIRGQSGIIDGEKVTPKKETIKD